MVKDEVNQNNEDEESDIPTDGWYKKNWDWYYYENGEMITNEIVEIEDEDGTYGYYFDDNGIMLKSAQIEISYLDKEKNIWVSGDISADENGHLYKGWNSNAYFGEDYFRYYNRTLEENGALYYFDNNGKLVVNQEVLIGDVLYKADENGVLTVQDTAGKNGWVKSGDNWYYYKDGEALKDTFEDINGAQYYFYFDGTMATGIFGVDNFRYWAEPSGQIIKTKGWYHSAQTNKWYWFDDNGALVINSLIDIKGTKYYLNWKGEMQTGVFEAYYEDETGEWVEKQLYANASGAVSTLTGWKSENGYWYYVKQDGTSAKNEIVIDNGKKYYIGYDGKMETGKFDVWSEKGYESYITDNSGAIITEKWVKNQMSWYYAGKEGSLLKDQWIDETYYVTYDGSMAIGKTTIGDKTYIFDENGHKEVVLETQKDGWHLADGIWYYIADGTLSTGWLDHTYYLRNGRIITDETVPAEHLEGKYSYVGQDGAIKSGWAKEWNFWQYFEKDEKTGDIVAFDNGWKKINGTWYYFDNTCMIADDIIEIDGKLSKFSASGAWEGYVDNKGWKQISSGG